MKYGKPLNENVRLVSKKLGTVRTPPLPVHFTAHPHAVDTLLHPHLRVKHLIVDPDSIIRLHQRRGRGVTVSRGNVVVGEQRARVTAVVAAWNAHVLCVTKMLN